MNTHIAVEIKAKSHSASNTAPRLGWLVYNPDAELEGFVDAGQMGHQALYQYFPRASTTILCSLHVTPAEWREAKRNQLTVTDTCERCHQRITFFREHWWSDDDDFMCPDGEEQHTPAQEKA